MRLLHIDNLTLHEYASAEDAPPYIIISHRWLDGEVSFQEVLRHDRDFTVGGKAGMRKIKAFCAFIKMWRDSYKAPKPPSEPLQIIPCHIWIDTCCINKESSAELQEAITSMFQWYGQAWCCLALLHDVNTASRGPKDVLHSIEQSVWFTRGWTLQELLAPKCVVFLDASWVVIGHKSHNEPLVTLSGEVVTWQYLKLPLNHYLSQITDIDERILWDYTYANNVTFEERLAWMFSRTTTRPEDRAYCMLGICEIYMPLLYGEGKNAMKRLHREIRVEHGITVKDSGQVQVPQLTPYQCELHLMTFGLVERAPQAHQPPPKPEHEAALPQDLQALQQQMMPQPGRETGFSGRELQDNATVLWTITKEEKKIYDDIFKAWDSSGKGHISSNQALEIFGQSGLDEEDLMLIWTLSDPHYKDGLNLDEFAVAMHLIYRALNGYSVPNQLPAELMPPSTRNGYSGVDAPVVAEENDVYSERNHQILEALHEYFLRVQTRHVWADDRGFVNVSDVMGGSRLKDGNVTFDEIVAAMKNPAGRSFKIQPTAFANEFSYSPADFEIKLRDEADNADLERSQSAPGRSRWSPLDHEE